MDDTLNCLGNVLLFYDCSPILNYCGTKFINVFFFFIWHSEYAEKHDFQVVEIFVGHGVGRIFHSEPLIYHQREY